MDYFIPPEWRRKLPNLKGKDIPKLLDLLAPFLRSKSGRRALMKQLGSFGGGGAVGGAAVWSRDKEASLDKAEYVYNNIIHKKK